MPSRPTRKNQQLLDAGLAAHTLATTHAARLTPRLPAGLVDGLATDLTALGALVPGALSARQERKGATSTVEALAAKVAARVIRIRGAITAAGLPAASRKAWGSGERVQAKVVKSVLAAAETIARRAAAQPDEVREAGILAADLSAIADDAAALGGVDRSQESKKLSAKSATAARNAAGTRIELAVRRIASAGELEFGEENDALEAEFAALVSGGAKAAKKPPKPAAS